MTRQCKTCGANFDTEGEENTSLALTLEEEVEFWDKEEEEYLQEEEQDFLLCPSCREILSVFSVN